MKASFAGLKAIFIAGILSLLTACVETVSYVDIPRYMGLWYQISANPSFFDQGLTGVTAEYTLQEDGTVRVNNRGFIGSLDGELSEIEGQAVVFDRETNASLKVSFPGQPNLPGPNYLIVVLDEVDYQYAAVTNMDTSFLFILSRTPQIDEALYQNILSELEAKNIDTSKLVLTVQPEL